MSRKAIFSSKNYSQEETMSRKDLEQYFTAVQQRLDDLEQCFEKRFDRLEKAMQSILNIVQSYDQERKEVKSTLWELDRRMLRIERKSA